MEMMLQEFFMTDAAGKVKAAVRWATEHTRGELLLPTDVVDDGSGHTILDVLH